MIFTPANQLQWAWSITKDHRFGLLSYFFLELLAIVFSLLFVVWSKQAVDVAMQTSPGALKQVLGMVVVAMLLALIFRTISGWVNERMRLKIGLRLQRSMVDFQMRSVWSVVKEWHSGDIQLRIQSDCQEVVNMVSYSAINSLLTLIRLVGSFAVLWSMDPMLALMLLGITPLFLFSKIYFKKMRSLSRRVKQAESTFGKVLQENLRFRMLIRAMDLLSIRGDKLGKSQDDIYSLKLEQLNFVNLSQTAMKFTINVGFLLTFIWGVYRLHTSEITFGTMTAFLQLVGRVQTPVLALLGFVPVFIRFRTSLDRLMELEAVEKEVESQPVKLSNIQELSVKNICFKYEDRPLIEGLSIRVEKGKPVAIMGSSGKGKTTFFRLLLGLVQPDEGDIRLIDGNQTYPLNPAHRMNFAYVPQGNSLFSGTVRENLFIGDSPVDETRVRHVLWVACAEFVYQLPEGLETRIGESGYGISEGQAQRIAVARALFRDCDIWLFDEITSALDKETSERLAERLLNEGQDKLCVFVTHDLTLTERCIQTYYIN